MYMKAAVAMLTVMLLILVAACDRPRDPNPVFGEMTDARDSQTYQTVTLGEQTWLAQDLNYPTDGSWCISPTSTSALPVLSAQST